MKKISIVATLFLSFIAAASIYGQGKKFQKEGWQEIKKTTVNLNSNKDQIICYGSDHNANTFVGLNKDIFGFAFNKASRASVNQQWAAVMNLPQKSTINVTYSTFFNAQAKEAFEKAKAVWERVLKSDIPINIDAVWSTALSRNTLGATSPQYFPSVNFQGALVNRAVYVRPLAEKLQRKNTNGNEPDIRMVFSAAYNWSYSADAISPSQTDFSTVVLHEIGHGLGFTSGFFVNAGVGSQSFTGGGGAPFPVAYDVFIQDNLDQNLVDITKYALNSAALGKALISDDLYYSSPSAVAATSTKPKIYAPTTYSGGSSIAHLDETSYKAGSGNSLMSPIIDNLEVNLDPGPIAIGIFKDMGWASSSIITELADQEDFSKPIVVEATIYSDSALVKGSVELMYTFDNALSATNAVKVPMTLKAGTSNIYSYTLPAQNRITAFNYALLAKDNTQKSFYSPVKDFFYSKKVGPDLKAPVLQHQPIAYEFKANLDTLVLVANVTDDYNLGGDYYKGVDTVFVDYKVNTGTSRRIGMRRIANGDFIAGLFFDTKTLKAEDKVSYTITALDRSLRKNQATTGQIDIQIIDIKAPVVELENNFESIASSDFVGNGLTITTTPELSSKAIQSSHPYKNGSGPGNQSFYDIILLNPITLKDKDAVLRFDEIVLVENGDKGESFFDNEETQAVNSSFYDWVGVLGSTDNGQTWSFFQDGWDCRDNKQWEASFVNSQSPDPNLAESVISSAIGKPDLIQKREINMLANGKFKPGDKVLIRFVLFADQLANGWGWWVDNLAIQKPIILAEEKPVSIDLAAYPNPTVNGKINFKAYFPKPSKTVKLELFNQLGKVAYQETFNNVQGEFKKEMELKQIPAGMYLLKMSHNGSAISRKILVK